MRKRTAFFCIILILMLLGSAAVSAQEAFEITGRTVIPTGASFALEAQGREGLSWESSDENVAKVDEAGVVTGISAGECMITARDTQGESGIGITVTDSKVSGVKAAMMNAARAKVRWNTVPGADGYRIYQSVDGAGYKAIATVSGGDVKELSASVTCGRKYSYKVRSYTDGIKRTWGAYSAAVTLNARPTTPKITVSAADNTSLKISWSKISGATGYQVYRAPSKNGKYTRIADIKSASYTDKSLKSGTTYYYKVRAYKTVSKKNVYGASSAAAGRRCGLKIPASFTVTSSYSGNTISWGKVSGAQRYQVFRKLAGESGFKLIARVEETKYADTTAPVGKPAQYRIRAYEKADGVNIYGAYTKTLTAYRRPNKAQIALTVAGSGKVKVSWEKVSGATHYAVYRSTSKNGTYKLISTVTGMSYTNSSLAIGTTYYYKVLPMTKYSGVTTKGYFSDKGAIVASPAKVSGLTTKIEANSRIKLSWKAVANASGYAVYRKEPDGAYTRLANIKGTTYTDSAVTANVKYTYLIRAYKKVGSKAVYGPSSNRITASVLLGTSEILSVKATDYTRLTVKWKAAGNAAGYQIWRRASDDATGKWVKVTSVNRAVTSYVDNAKKSGVKYYYKIRPYAKTEQGTVYGMYTEEFARTMPVKYFGIDVSKWQGKIDWKAVKDSGIGFVMIRASYTYNDKSGIVTDERFYENIEGAKAAGLKVGLYAYCTHTKVDNVIKEANYILNLAKDYEIDLPIAYDYERKDVDDYTSMAQTFCETIEQAGYSACIYATPAYFSMNSQDTHLDYSRVSSYPQWVARYRESDTLDFMDFVRIEQAIDRGFYNPLYPEANEENAIMWQYTSKGRVPGISVNVDMNIMYF